MEGSFGLVRNKTGELVPLSLVDEELCILSNMAPHKELYLWSWVDSIGFRLQSGETYPEVRKKLESMLEMEVIKNDEHHTLLVHRWISILGYLELNFTVRREP